MELSGKTKIDDLLNQYPFLLDFLITLSPKFENLKNPIMRKTLGKIATLNNVSVLGGIDLGRLMSSIAAEIEKQTDETVIFDESYSGDNVMDPEERQQALKGIIKGLHAGEDMDVLKQMFGQLIKGLEATEVAQMEQSLMDEDLL